MLNLGSLLEDDTLARSHHFPDRSLYHIYCDSLIPWSLSNQSSSIMTEGLHRMLQSVTKPYGQRPLKHTSYECLALRMTRRERYKGV